MYLKNWKIEEESGERYYISKQGRFPSVNTILDATQSPEKKKRIAIWAKKSREKWLRSQRKCKNCTYLTRGKCEKGQTGEKLKSPWRKNRCQSFQLRVELDTYDPGSEARRRGTDAHHWIEQYFRTGKLAEVEDFPQRNQIKYFLENLREGTIAVEEAVFSLEHGYAGRVDFCGVYEDRIVVVDWTTTARGYIEKKWYADKLTQAAAYAIAIEEGGTHRVDEVIVIVMGPKKATMFRDPKERWAGQWMERLAQYKKQEQRQWRI